MAFTLQCLKQLRKQVLQINAINYKTWAKNGIVDNIRPKNKLLLPKNSCIMIMQNLQTLKELINDIVSTIYNMIQEDGVEDVFTAMPVVILMIVDNCASFANILVNSVYVMPVVPAKAQWEVKHEVYQRKQFPLIFTFTITIYKSQGLTLARVILNFKNKNFTFSLSYVAPLQV